MYNGNIIFIPCSFAHLVSRLPLHASLTFWALQNLTKYPVVFSLLYCMVFYRSIVARNNERTRWCLANLRRRASSGSSSNPLGISKYWPPERWCPKPPFLGIFHWFDLRWDCRSFACPNHRHPFSLDFGRWLNWCYSYQGKSSLHLFWGAWWPNKGCFSAFLGQGMWQRFRSWYLAGRCECTFIQGIASDPLFFGRTCRMLLAQVQICSLPSQCTGP